MKKVLCICMLIAAGIVTVSCDGQKQCSDKNVNDGTEIGAAATPQAMTANGVIEGINESGVAVFKGVPFAAPPVGDLRWKAPQPVESWEGVRDAKEFGPNSMQLPIFGDMMFGTDINSEDCLYLNIWTPAKSTGDRLPVFIYYHGGGLMAGSGSEPRYAGMSFARNGVVAITVNYRQGIFGFFAHPELSAETEYKGSGNYGYMDQAAALQWVKCNIAAFGGDPDRITIMGESAGSYSVSALMASPLSKDNIAQAMGSSGATVASPWATLEEAETVGTAFMKEVNCADLAELRAMSAQELLTKATGRIIKGNIDNYFMPKQPYAIYEDGEQAQVPCLIGNNSAEMTPQMVCGSDMTVAGMRSGIATWLGDEAAEEDVERLLTLYGINEDSDVTQLPGYAAAGDKFIVYGTWKWTDLQQAHSPAPVYRYRFCKARPELIDKNKVSALAGGTKDKKEAGEESTPSVPGAAHSVDIEYQMGTIPTTPVYAWTADDFSVSEVFEQYFLNFIKTGNPNGLGLVHWDPINGEAVPPVMCIDLKCYQEKNADMQERYRILDKYLYLK